jgi:membrane protease YdiL (CAAX protease family)
VNKYTLQGLLALFISAAIFVFSPTLLYALDPTAGSFDLGYLQKPLVAAAWFFFATFCAWVALQLDWPDLNKWIDGDDGLAKDFKGLSGLGKIVLSLIVFGMLFVGFLVCLALVPA